MAIKARKITEELVLALVEANNLRMTDAVSTFFHADTTQLTGFDRFNPSVTDDTITGSAIANDVDAIVAATATSASADTYSGAEILADSSWTEPDYVTATLSTAAGAYTDASTITVTGTYLGAAVTDVLTISGTGGNATLWGDQLFDAGSVTSVAVEAQADTDGAISIGRAYFPESMARVNAIKLTVNRHFADTRAHNTAVSAAIATATATTLTTANALATAIKAAYNTHLSASNVHFTNDSTNTISAADATTLATLIALINELRTDFNAHVISAPAGTMIEVVAP